VDFSWLCEGLDELVIALLHLGCQRKRLGSKHVEKTSPTRIVEPDLAQEGRTTTVTALSQCRWPTEPTFRFKRHDRSTKTNPTTAYRVNRRGNWATFWTRSHRARKLTIALAASFQKSFLERRKQAKMQKRLWLQKILRTSPS
jgi:hypothetical protein